jgi:hypothetical protein
MRLRLLGMAAAAALLGAGTPGASAATLGPYAAVSSRTSFFSPQWVITDPRTFIAPGGTLSGGQLTIRFSGDTSPDQGEFFRVQLDGADFGIVNDGNTGNDSFDDPTDLFTQENRLFGLYWLTAPIGDALLGSLLADGALTLTLTDLPPNDWIDWWNYFEWEVTFTQSRDDGNGGTAVPEPASLALFGAGLLGLAAARRRRRRA